MRHLLMAGLVLMGVALSAPAGAQQKLWKRQFGHWSVEAFLLDGLYYCAMSNMAPEGWGVTIFANQHSRHSRLWLYAETWALPTRDYSVIVRVDARWQNRMVGDAHDKSLFADIVDFSFYEAFANGLMLWIDFPSGHWWRFSLNGSAAALSTYRTCVAELMSGGSVHTNPFETPRY